jgi:hypothetical protein
MLLEAVVENGFIRLLKPVQFVHQSCLVKVVIPDDEVLIAHPVDTQKNRTDLPSDEVVEFQKLSNALFSGGYRYTPDKSDNEILGDILSEKYAR